MYCPNCGAMVLHKDCSWCGPAELYAKNPKYCADCGGLKNTEDPPKDKTDLVRRVTRAACEEPEAESG